MAPDSATEILPDKMGVTVGGAPAKVVLREVTLDIEQNTKLAIVGRNGCGKSTLLQFLSRHEGCAARARAAPSVSSAGESEGPVAVGGEFHCHPSLRIAHYQQHQQDSLPYALSPLQHLTEESPIDQRSEQVVRAHLGAFGISGDLALMPIGTLSGGQKARVVLAVLTLCRPHLLLLDEPTNNLDLDGVRALTAALTAYEGAFIVASHDMNFVESVAGENVFRVAKGEYKRLEGGVSEYKSIVRDIVSRQRRNM